MKYRVKLTSFLVGCLSKGNETSFTTPNGDTYNFTILRTENFISLTLTKEEISKAVEMFELNVIPQEVSQLLGYLVFNNKIPNLKILKVTLTDGNNRFSYDNFKLEEIVKEAEKIMKGFLEFSVEKWTRLDVKQLKN